MNLTIRKNVERQVLLTEAGKVFDTSGLLRSTLCCAGVCLFLSMATGKANADIYRFVTIDGVETFTDAPSDKSATVIIRDKAKPAAKQHKSTKKQKTHDISLEEVVQRAVAASLTPQESAPVVFEQRLPAVGGVITSKVGMRIDPIDGSWRQHNGVDIAIPIGTPIRAVNPGTVVYSGTRSGYGNTVVVEHDNGIITLYAHNSRLMVAEGQAVTRDTLLALSGSTGRSTGPHLHFEAWQAGSNVTAAFLPDSGVTLPKASLIASSHRAPRFRSETLSDGSILFTNIPVSTP